MAHKIEWVPVTGTPLKVTEDGGTVHTVATLDDISNAAEAVPVRQTVLSSSVDSNGLPDYISIGTGLSVDIAATSVPVIIAAANGFNSSGRVDRVGTVSADTSIGSLTASSTCFLYADIAADGSVTFGHTTLAPAYQWGGAYSTTSDQFTFNIQEMVAKVGNGATAVQTYRVYIGEAVTDVSSVTSVVNYALAGRYNSGSFSLALSTTYTKSHNIGIPAEFAEVVGYFRESTSEPWMLNEWGYVDGSYGVIFSNADRNSAKINTATFYIGSSGWVGFTTASTTGLGLVMARRAF